jgi:hypothetical protein
MMRMEDGAAAVEHQRTKQLLRRLLREFENRGGFLTGDAAALEAWAQIQDTVRALGRLSQLN